MIEIICDKCEKTFEARPNDAGGKMPCPFCGDINKVPSDAVVESRNASDESRTETEICKVRPAMFRAHPFRYLFILSLLLAGVGGTIWSMVSEPVGQWVAWIGAVLSLIALIWFAKWWLTATLWMKLVVSDKRTVRHEGIVKRHTTEVLHNHVRSVDIRQKFLQRLFNVGSVGIDSAGQDGIEIEIHDIPRPYEIKRIIDKYRRM